MSDVRAFIGHSFTKDDERLIVIFQKYFTTLEKSGLSFSWVSAEPAEPTELAAKVLKLIEDRNEYRH